MAKKRILVIDDEINILNSLRRILDGKYIVDTALGAEKASKLFVNSNTCFDVILCDFMMPNMNGEDFYHFISKTSPQLKNKIIFMTGGKYTDDMQKFFDDTSMMTLPKPFSTEELLLTIEKVTSLDDDKRSQHEQIKD